MILLNIVEAEDENCPSLGWHWGTQRRVLLEVTRLITVPISS